MKLKSFDTLWKFYPETWSVQWTLYQVFLESKNTPSETKTWVVEKVKNACVLRLCYALNCSPNPIRCVKIGANYLIGVNGYYLTTVISMRKYLEVRYGKPNYETLLKGDQAREFLKGKKGIICFVIERWKGATGHVDLWDGFKVRKSEYFNHELLDKILLWEVSD